MAVTYCHRLRTNIHKGRRYTGAMNVIRGSAVLLYVLRSLIRATDRYSSQYRYVPLLSKRVQAQTPLEMNVQLSYSHRLQYMFP